MGQYLYRPQRTSFDACVLQPELLENIAEYVDAGVDMKSFVQAFPPELLTQPLRHLNQLLHLIEPDDVWPYLTLSPDAIIDTNTFDLLEKVMVLYSSVQVRYVNQAMTLPLLPTTQIELVHFHMDPSSFNIVTNQWKSQITSLEILMLQNPLPNGNDQIFQETCLTSLCQGILHLPRLRRLQLRLCVNPLLVAFYQFIAAITSSSIEILCLEFAQETIWPNEIATEFFNWITTSSIKQIHLENVHLLNEAAHLCRSLSLSSTLTTLILRDCSFQSVLVHHQLPLQLCHLNLTFSTFIDTSSVLNFVQNSNLEKLELCFSKEQSEIAFHSELFAQTLQSLPKLRCLELQFVMLSNLDCAQVANSLSKLKKLVLDFNQIDDNGAMALAIGLQNATKLRKLYLRHQNIGDIGALAIASAISSIPNFEILSFEKNYIGSAGALGMCDLVKNFTCLYSLVLRSNPIGKSGVLALLTAMALNPEKRCCVDIVDTLNDDDDEDAKYECKMVVGNLPTTKECYFH